MAAVQHLYASDYGLGDGVTADGTAIQAALADVSASKKLFDRFVKGMVLEFPPGKWISTDTLGGTGNLIRQVIESPTSGGTSGWVILRGQGSGSTVIQAPTGGTGGVMPVVSGTPTRSGTTFTVTTVAAHGLSKWDPIVFQVTSRAAPVWLSSTVTAVPTSTTFQFVMGDPGGTSTQLNALRPATGSTIYQMGWLLEPIGFDSGNWLIIEDMSIIGPGGTPNPNSLPSPSIGYGLRRTARVNTVRCEISGWWQGETLCGSPHGTGGDVGSNTDHTESFRCTYQNNVDHVGIIANQAVDLGDVGGTRDNIYRDCVFGASGRSFMAIADDGQAAAVNLEVVHAKSTPFPIYIEGVEGTLPAVSTPKITLLNGSVKFESPGNCAIVWDESRLCTWDASLIAIRSEVAIDINGQSNNADGTFKPWAATAISMTSAVITATLPTGHNVRVGDHVVIGGTGNTSCDGASIVSSVVGNTIQMPRPDYTGANIPGPLTGIAGLICGLRMGILDGVHMTWNADYSASGNQLARSAFWWDIEHPNDTVIDILAGEDLISFTMEDTTRPAAYDTLVTRALNRYTVRGHASSDQVAILAGHLVEVTTRGNVIRSTASRNNVAGGVAMQGSPTQSTPTTTVAAVGSGVNAQVIASRGALLCAQPMSSLTSAGDPTNVVVTGAPANGDTLVDNGDGTAVTISTALAGRRVIGVATAAAASGGVDADLCSPIYAGVSVVAKSSAYTMTSNDDVVLASGTTTITLPSAVTAAVKRYTIKNVNAGATTVTINTTASQTIDGAATATLTTANSFLEVVPDGANWRVI